MAKQVVGFEAQVDTSQAVNSVKSLKAQLREAQQEVMAMSDKFGDASEQAIKAAQKAAQLKDRIGDAKALTEAFNPDRKFAALGTAIQGVAGGFAAVQGAMGLLGSESEDLEKMLLKVNSAMALVQGLNALTEAEDGFSNLKKVAVNSLNAIKGAIGSTGIGLLVIAVGTIYAYWDDIKTAVTGVSEETKKAAAEAHKKLETSEKELNAVDETSNILKLQGKSERDILKIKQEKIKLTIRDARLDLEKAASIAESQNIAEKRGYEILKNLTKIGLEFNVAAFRIVAAPLDLLVKTANSVAESLGFSKITTVSLNEEISKLTSKGAETLSKFVFNPEKTREEGKKTVDEAKAKLTKLLNEEAGYKLQVQQLDKEDADKADKNNKDRLADAKELRDAKNQTYLDSIKDENFRAKEELRIKFETLQEDLKNSEKTAQQKNALKLEYEKQYALELAKLEKDQSEKKAKEDLEKQNQIDKAITEQRLAAIKDEYYKRQYQLEINRQTELDKQAEAYNKGLISLEEYNASVAGINSEFDKQQIELRKQIADEKVKIAEDQKNKELAILEEKQKKELELSKSIADGINFYKSLIELNSQEITNRQKKDNDIQKELLDSNQISKEQYEANIAAINEKAEKKKRQLQRQSIIAENAMTIANIILNTLQANAKSLAAFPLTFGQPWIGFNTAQGILGVATTIAQTAKALSALGGGSVGGANTNFGNKAGAPLSPQAQTTSLNQNQINQLASATSRAFVLESDVSGSQERIRRINRAARIN